MWLLPTSADRSMTSTATRVNQRFGAHDKGDRNRGGIRERSYCDIESRKKFFDRDNSNNVPRRRRVVENDEPPKASLLKYEVRKLVDLRKVSNNFEAAIKDRPDNGQFISNNLDSALKERQGCKEERENAFEKPLDRNKENKKREKMTADESCVFCKQYQKQLKEMEEEFEREKKENEAKFIQLEQKLDQSVNEREDFNKKIKKLQREVKKIESTLDEEKMQTRRLGIKLEDANYEIGRLRQELITTQLENEKIVEENEDLAVDNEDLIKERDEIITIYDELYRESERLKHEVKIWKSILGNNTEALTNDLPPAEENHAEKELPDEEDEGVILEIEEDTSLLLPSRHDVTMKKGDPNKMFEMADELGRGKFGKIYKAVEKSTGDVYAAKYIKVTSKLREDVLNTVEIMKKLHQVRLMNVIDVYDLGAQIIIIQEYVSGGLLFERIIAKQSLTEADCVGYMKQILQGLCHMHSKNICHLELKPENIVCVNSKTMDIKLIDFGLAKQLENKKDIKVTAGSPEFVAPEILSFDPVSLASDMWSVGVLAYVMLSGISPFIGEDDNDTLLNVSCGEYEFPGDTFEQISNDAKQFIDSLLVSNPKKRANVVACLTHTWMKANPQSKKIKIDLENMKTFLEKRKDKPNVSAVRAIRRFSSFGVGHGTLNSRTNPMMRTGSSRLLTVPNALQATAISEENEENEEDQLNNNISNGPMVKITRDSIDSIASTNRSRANSSDLSVDIPEDTTTPDGLRQYLQRMISEGHLPGSNGPPNMNEHSDDER